MCVLVYVRGGGGGGGEFGMLFVCIPYYANSQDSMI